MRGPDRSKIWAATAAGMLAWPATACVSGSAYNSVVAEMQSELDATRRDLVAQRDAERELAERCGAELAAARSHAQKLETEVAALEDTLQRLRGEQGELSHEREALDRELAELRRLRQALYPDHGSSEPQPGAPSPHGPPAATSP